jgi:hypothetical protein
MPQAVDAVDEYPDIHSDYGGRVPGCFGATCQSETPVLKDVGIDQLLNNQVPSELQFTDENGRSVKLSDYGDKPIVLRLFITIVRSSARRF